MDDWAELERTLGAIAASERAEVREDGQWLAEFSPARVQIRRQAQGAIVHLWSNERNLTRRILCIQGKSGDRVLLEVQRFGRAKPSRLEFLCGEGSRAASRVSREQFRVRIREILLDAFPDAALKGLTVAQDLKNSFSGLYVRGQMHEGSGTWAVLAAPPAEETPSVEASLAFGILWLHRLRSHARQRAVEGLRLFVPEGAGLHLRERVLALSSSARAEIFEFSMRDGQVRKLDPADVGNLESRLLPRPEIDSILRAACEAASRIPSLASKSAESNTPIAQRLLPGTTDAVFSFRGLDFARWSIKGLFFGLDDFRLPLTAASEAALGKLLCQLEQHRNPLTEEISHPLYRKAPERWIETMIREDPTRLDARLDARYLYAQLPAFTAGSRGILDLLGVTRRGRLVIIELKASEDIQLPMQAMDYWLRVRRHQREGDFERFGYFPGIELDSEPPLVWLVAPGLQFHSTTDIFLKYFSPEIQVTRIGLNENWRRGLKVVFRQ